MKKKRNNTIQNSDEINLNIYMWIYVCVCVGVKSNDKSMF